MSEKRKWQKVGTIREGKKCAKCSTFLIESTDGRECPKCGHGSGRLYIKLDEVADLFDGVTLMFEDPRDNLEKLYELGHIETEEELEQRLEKIPFYIRKELKLPPQD